MKELMAISSVLCCLHACAATPSGSRVVPVSATAANPPAVKYRLEAKDLNGKWTVDPQPMLPWSETCENSSLYFEPANKTWFLFTNHINRDYTDAIWVYWTKDLNKWNAEHKAVVLDGRNCTWSKACIGLPSVLKVGNRLAVFYDAPGGDSVSDRNGMNRDIGLAWLELPLGPRKE